MFYVLDFTDCKEVHTGTSRMGDVNTRKRLLPADVRVGLNVVAKWGADKKWYYAEVIQISEEPVNLAFEEAAPATRQQRVKSAKDSEKRLLNQVEYSHMLRQQIQHQGRGGWKGKSKAQEEVEEDEEDEEEEVEEEEDEEEEGEEEEVEEEEDGEEPKKSKPGWKKELKRLRERVDRVESELKTAKTRVRNLEKALQMSNSFTVDGRRRLAKGSEVAVPGWAYTNASESTRLGNALQILVPLVFTEDELLKRSTSFLSKEKVSALTENNFPSLRERGKPTSIKRSVSKFLGDRMTKAKKAAAAAMVK